MKKTPEEILGKHTGMTLGEDIVRIQTQLEYIISAMEEYAEAYHQEKQQESKLEAIKFIEFAAKNMYHPWNTFKDLFWVDESEDEWFGEESRKVTTEQLYQKFKQETK